LSKVLYVDTDETLREKPAIALSDKTGIIENPVHPGSDKLTIGREVYEEPPKRRRTEAIAPFAAV